MQTTDTPITQLPIQESPMIVAEIGVKHIVVHLDTFSFWAVRRFGRKYGLKQFSCALNALIHKLDRIELAAQNGIRLTDPMGFDEPDDLTPVQYSKE